QRAAGPAPAPAAEKAERWEHGEVSFLRKPKSMARWITARATVEAGSWEGLAVKLKAPEAGKGATEATHRLRVMDRLSAQGGGARGSGRGGRGGGGVGSCGGGRGGGGGGGEGGARGGFFW